DVLVDAAVVVTLVAVPAVAVFFVTVAGRLGCVITGRVGTVVFGHVGTAVFGRLGSVIVPGVQVAVLAGLEQGERVDGRGTGVRGAEYVVDELVVAATVVDDEGGVAERRRVGRAGLVGMRVRGRLGDQGPDLEPVTGDRLRDRPPHVRRR